MRQKNQVNAAESVASVFGDALQSFGCHARPLAERLQRLAKHLKIDGQVRWLGFQQNPFASSSPGRLASQSSDHEGIAKRYRRVITRTDSSPLYRLSIWSP